jgi:hypothetical protein
LRTVRSLLADRFEGVLREGLLRLANLDFPWPPGSPLISVLPGSFHGRELQPAKFLSFLRHHSLRPSIASDNRLAARLIPSPAKLLSFLRHHSLRPSIAAGRLILKQSPAGAGSLGAVRAQARAAFFTYGSVGDLCKQCSHKRRRTGAIAPVRAGACGCLCDAGRLISKQSPARSRLLGGGPGASLGRFFSLLAVSKACASSVLTNAGGLTLLHSFVPVQLAVSAIPAA